MRLLQPVSFRRGAAAAAAAAEEKEDGKVRQNQFENSLVFSFGNAAPTTTMKKRLRSRRSGPNKRCLRITFFTSTSLFSQFTFSSKVLSALKVKFPVLENRS